MNTMADVVSLNLLEGEIVSPIVLDKVEDAVTAIARGEMVIVVDDADRENEGDLIMAADAVTPADINFMATEGRGLICVSLSAERLEQLELPQMVGNNTEFLSTGFTITCDLREGTTTGISASDRAKTIRALTDDNRVPGDFNRPGHVFPLRAHPEGVLGRPGHTEASLDLSRLAGRSCGGVLCEIALPDGEMARLPDLAAVARRYGLKLISIEDLIAWRRANDRQSEAGNTPFGLGGTVSTT